MKKVLLTLFIAFEYFISLAQPSILMQKTFGGSGEDYSYAISPTFDGGNIVAGWSDSPDGDKSVSLGLQDYWILKLNSQDNIQWQKSLGGTNNDNAFAIKQTTDGGYIVAGGSYSNDGNVTGNKGDEDFWIVKLNNKGNIKWQRSLGGSGQDYAYDVVQTSDGGYLVAGTTYSSDGDVVGNHGGADYWVVKLGKGGNVQWKRALGGSGEDMAWSIQNVVAGGYIVAGWSNSNDGDVTGSLGDYDYWVVRLRKNGTVKWQKSFGGSGEDRGFSIDVRADSGFVVAGWSASTDGDVTGNQGGRDFWVAKLSNIGTLQAQNSFGGTSEDVATNVEQSTDGGFIISGYTQSNDGDVSFNNGFVDYWLVKTNSSLAIEWEKSLGGSGDDAPGRGYQTANSGYILPGRSNSDDGDVTGHKGNGDYWIVELSNINARAFAEEIKQLPNEELKQFSTEYNVYPNPTSDYFNCEFVSSTNENVVISLIDLSGRILLSQSVQVKEGYNLIQKDVSKLSKGIYYLHIESSEANSYIKVLVK